MSHFRSTVTTAEAKSITNSEHALLFDLAGDRFVDETVGDHLTTWVAWRQPLCFGLAAAGAAMAQTPPSGVMTCGATRSGVLN